MGISKAFRKIFILCALASMPAYAQQSTTLYPKAISHYINDVAKNCYDQDGSFRLEENAVEKFGDINLDGKPDYFLNLGGFHCDVSGYSEWCGTAGCLVIVAVSTPKGYLRAYSNNVQEIKFAKLNSKPVIKIASHGMTCGHKSGVETCYSNYVWKGTGLGQISSKGVIKSELMPEGAVDEPFLPPPTPLWKVEYTKNKTPIAVYKPTNSDILTKLVISCAENQPAVFVSLKINDNKPKVIKLDTGAIISSNTVGYSGSPGIWLGVIKDKKIITQLTTLWGKGTFTVNDNGYDNVSFRGSKDAVKLALAKCTK